MLIIRLQRVGKRGQAYFRVVVMEHTKKTTGEALDILGSYDPHLKKFEVDKEKIESWISKGSQVSPTVNNLLVNYKYWDKPKMPSWKPKRKEKQEEAPKTETNKGAANIEKPEDETQSPGPEAGKEESSVESKPEEKPVDESSNQ